MSQESEIGLETSGEMGDGQDITRLLALAADGNQEAFAAVSRWAYADLERLAASRLRRRYRHRAGTPTLEPKALVNETFLSLLEKPTRFEGRRHFLAFASKVMLDTLIDYERRRAADKRGGRHVRVTLTLLEAEPGSSEPGASTADLLAFRETVEQLDELSQRKADVVRLRVLWGMEVKEAARLLGVSEPTVVRDWRFSRHWIAERMGLPITGREPAVRSVDGDDD